MAFGAGICLNGPAAAQQLQLACDANDDGFVDAQESKLCTDREFDEIAAGEQVLTEEALKAKADGGKGMPTFAEPTRMAMGRSAARNGSASAMSVSPARPRQAAAA